MSSPEAVCKCGHGHLLHVGKLNMGTCNSWGCNCSRYSPKSRLSEKVETLSAALLSALDLLEQWPISATDSDFDTADRKALIRQAQKALGVSVTRES